jgi:hypothetical protein
MNDTVRWPPAEVVITWPPPATEDAPAIPRHATDLVPVGNAADFVADATAKPQRRKARGARKPTLVSVAKQVRKAGIEVARYEIGPDGKIVVVPGKPEATEVDNPWLAEIKKQTMQ